MARPQPSAGSRRTQGSEHRRATRSCARTGPRNRHDPRHCEPAHRRHGSATRTPHLRRRPWCHGIMVRSGMRIFNEPVTIRQRAARLWDLTVGGVVGVGCMAAATVTTGRRSPFADTLGTAGIEALTMGTAAWVAPLLLRRSSGGPPGATLLRSSARGHVVGIGVSLLLPQLWLLLLWAEVRWQLSCALRQAREPGSIGSCDIWAPRPADFLTASGVAAAVALARWVGGAIVLPWIARRVMMWARHRRSTPPNG